MSPMLLTILVSGLAMLAVTVAAMAMFGPALAGEDRGRKRLEAVAAREAQKGRGMRDREKERRKIVQETLKELEQKQKEQRAKMTLKRRLEQAGLSVSPRVFYGVSVAVGLAIGLVAFVLRVNPPWVALLIGFAAGFGAPRWVLGFLAGMRKKKFAAEFANAIDIIVRGVKSGLPLGECLQIIARESQSPLKEEFQAIVDAQKVGVTLDQALLRMYESMPVPEVNFFAIVLTIQMKTGGNLSEALGNLAAVLRGRKTLKGKIDAMSSEAKASAAIIGALPPGVMIMVYLSTPKYVSLLWTEHLGQLMLMGGALWMLTGVLVMRKMINFNF
ncbi:MAG: type II secretion system F family protein [Alphaproteobacteria bacterium]